MVRLSSAVLLIAAVGATLWWAPPWATVALAAIVGALAAGELAQLAARVDAGISPGVLATVVAVVVIAAALHTSGEAGGSRLAVVLLASLVVLGAVTLSAGPPSSLTRAGTYALGVLYLGVPLGAIASMRAVEGAGTLTWLLLVVVASDSGQYYAGRSLGRRKLAPVVSPGKTIEGAIGGALAAGLAGVLAAPALVARTLSPVDAAVIAVCLALVGLVGDLFESMLKRGAGVKDSSPLIPGHGGVLDRIDSYLFAGPLFFLFLRVWP